MSSEAVKKTIGRIVIFIVMLALWMLLICGNHHATAGTKPPIKSKFYDFNEQLIDGEIRKPTALYMDATKRARFGRLLSLKKSFLPKMFLSSKEKVFKQRELIVKLPYMKESLFIAIGLNISFFVLSIATSDWALMLVSITSSGACAYAINKMKQPKCCSKPNQ